MAVDATQIDKLSLNISVKDNNSAKKIYAVSNAIRNLTNSLKGLNAVSDQLKALQDVFAGINAIGSRTRNIGTGRNVLQTASLPDNEEVKGQLAIARNEKLNAQLAKTNAETEKHIAQTKKAEAQTEKTRKQTDKIKESLNGVSKATKKTTGFFGSFIKSVGRIALYRLIRTALKEITQAFTEGIQNYAKYDKATNEAMSKITNSTNQLKNTLGVTLGQIMQSLAPIFEGLIDLTTELFNNINKALASLRGKDAYSKAIKQNEDYAKSLDKVNGKLLSFDTFTTLTKEQDTVGFFKEEDISVLDKILGTVAAIGGSALFIWLTSGGFDKVKDKLKGIFDKLSGVKDVAGDAAKETKNIAKNMEDAAKNAETSKGWFSKMYDTISPMHIIILGITEALSGWSQVFDDSVTGAKKFFAWITAIAGTIAVIAGVLAAFLPTGAAKVAKAVGFGAAIAGGITSIIGTFMPNAYADGGSFNTSDMFYANENGNTELIASNNRGGAVMNMEQLQSAIYNGMILAMADSGDKEIVLKVDNNTLGKVVANSTGFISETNRRNSSFKLV